MTTLFTYSINRNGALFAQWSFVLSTIWFLLYLATGVEGLLGLGIGLLVLFVVLSPISLAILIVNALVHYRDIKQHVIAIFMVLVSTSIIILYITLLSNF